METKFWKKKVHIIKNKTVRFDNVNLKLWKSKIFISLRIWTGNIERLLIQFGHRNEKGMYGKGVNDRNDMEYVFDFDKQSDETDSWWEEISGEISSPVTNYSSLKLSANVLVLNN